MFSLKLMQTFLKVFVFVSCQQLYFAQLASFFSNLVMPTCDRAGVTFSTVKSTLPQIIEWKTLSGNQSLAKELINPFERVVILSGGTNPVPINEWDTFQPGFLWQKNIDRNILFTKTAFLRSPQTSVTCEQNKSCIKVRELKGYTWIELAQPKCVRFLPGTTDILKPAKGFVAIKTIVKCQVVLFEDFVYQLGDGKGNFYAMHATETGIPTLDVVLPTGWFIEKVILSEPLIVQPVGGGDECYFNILGDHLGQGYHQYIFAGTSYP